MTTDRLVAEACGRLPKAEAERALREIGVWLDHRRAIAAAARQGLKVAPVYAQPLHVQLFGEATRLARIDDPTWPVWEAFAVLARREEDALS